MTNIRTSGCHSGAFTRRSRRSGVRCRHEASDVMASDDVMLSLSKHRGWHDRGPCFDKLSMTTVRSCRDALVVPFRRGDAARA
jgi:hypothetical protein